jgi:hypothetical protein
VPRTKIMGPALVGALAMTAIVADTAAADTKSLNLYESEGFKRQSLAPGATFSMGSHGALRPRQECVCRERPGYARWC